MTCIGDMPLNSIPPTTTLQNFITKINAAYHQSHIDVRFIGGVVQENSDSIEINRLIDSGISGFKCFLINSGVSEFTHVNESHLRSALSRIQGSGKFLMFHAELEDEDDNNNNNNNDNQIKDKEEVNDPKKYKTFLESRPRTMENKAIELVIKLCKEYKVHCHIVHLSSSDALPLIRKAKEEGVPLTVETCYHYLYFESETIPEGKPQYKCCPPIREAENREKLWEALKEGIIDIVVTDHSPCTPDLKQVNNGSYLDSWGGISSLQFGLSILHTQALKRNIPITTICKWLCDNPAKLLGISHRKGKIDVGFDADFAVFNPNKTFIVNSTDIQHKNKLTAYESQQFTGQVVQTILRGTVIYDDGSFYPKPIGNLLLSN